MSDNWATPQSFVDHIQEIFELKFDMDACASLDSKKVDFFYSEDTNSLVQRWHGSVWCNPPYSKKLKRQFVEKAINECHDQNVQVIVMLIPARTDTKLFHDVILKNAKSIYFIKGRINFILDGNTYSGSTTASMLVFFTPNSVRSQSIEASMYALDVPKDKRREKR